MFQNFLVCKAELMDKTELNTIMLNHFLHWYPLMQNFPQDQASSRSDTITPYRICIRFNLVLVMKKLLSHRPHWFILAISQSHVIKFNREHGNSMQTLIRNIPLTIPSVFDFIFQKETNIFGSFKKLRKRFLITLYTSNQKLIVEPFPKTILCNL